VLRFRDGDAASSRGRPRRHESVTVPTRKGVARVIAATRRRASIRAIARSIREMAMTARVACEASGDAILRVGLARSAADIEAAQRLRWRVFAGEMGARLAARSDGRDVDCFDDFCEHLVVRDERDGTVVGTYRVLTAERARRLGTFYAETEFDLTRIERLKPGLCEIGRACIDPAWRGGAVLMLLWQGIATLMRERGSRHLIGCASIPMDDGGANARRVWRDLAPAHLAPIEYRVFARDPLIAREAEPDAPDGCDRAAASVPPLLRAYLRMGAWIAGDPAVDADFRTADLCMLLPLERVEARYARHWLKAA
jgi:putative hemolysin